MARTKAAAPKKRGRPKKTASATPKKRGRPKKKTAKKRGRPKKATSDAAPKKRGRPKKTTSNAAPKKRGRPKKKVAKKRGRPLKPYKDEINFLKTLRVSSKKAPGLDFILSPAGKKSKCVDGVLGSKKRKKNPSTKEILDLIF